MVPTSFNPTPTEFATSAPNLVRKLWSDTYMNAIRIADNVYSGQMGSSVSSNPKDGARIVEIANDPSKGDGQEVIYGIKRETYKQGIRGVNGSQGNPMFTAQTQYNTRTVGYDAIKVALFRQSFKTNVYIDDVMGWKQDLAGGELELTARNVGRAKQRDLMMTSLHRSGVENRFYAGGVSKLNDLTTSNTLTYNDLVISQSLLTAMGATPAYVRMDGNGNDVMGYHIITTGETYGRLKLDPTVQSILKASAAAVGNDSELLTGGLRNLDGHTIQWFNQVQHKDAGEVGSPFQPFAFLGTAIGDANTPVTTTEAILGGRNATNAADTEINYFTDFPSSGYRFLNGDTTTTAVQSYNPYYVNNDFWGFRGSDPSDTTGSVWDGAPYFYIGIANPKNATTQPGKWSIYKIAVSANNLNRFTGMVERLGPTVAGIQKTTVGNVTFDSAVHATYHGLESRIFLCNANGVPIAASPMHGAAALRRANGSMNDAAGHEVYQRIFRLVYMDNIIGHGLRRDAGGVPVGIMNIVHAVQYYDFNHATG